MFLHVIVPCMTKMKTKKVVFRNEHFKVLVFRRHSEFKRNLINLH